MQGVELVAAVGQAGARLGVDGGRLYVEPASAVPQSLLSDLRAQKAELLRLLETPAVADSIGGVRSPGLVTVAEVCAMPLSEFAQAGLVVSLWSDVLGESVVLASDNAILDPGERRPVYRASEAKALLGIGPADLRRVHALKRTFKGTVEA